MPKEFYCFIEVADMPARKAYLVARERGYDLSGHNQTATKNFYFSTDVLPAVGDELEITQQPGEYSDRVHGVVSALQQ